MMLAA